VTHDDCPRCASTPLTDALMHRLGASAAAPAIRGALGVSLCGPSATGSVLLAARHRVAKASGVVSEMSQIRDIEDELFRAMLGAYVEKANAAIIAGISVLPKKQGVVKKQDLSRVLRKADNTFFRGWTPPSLERLMDESVRQTYMLAQQAVLRKHLGAKDYKDKALVYKVIASAAIKPSFDLIDEQAVEAMETQQRFWVKAPGVWTNADDLIKNTGTLAIEGLPYEQAGPRLQGFMESAYGTGKSLAKGAAYWEGVAVNAVTTARVQGALREMHSIGVTTYTLSNPMDQRTSAICQHMDGKRMYVEDAISVIDQLSTKGTSPSAVRKLHPWHPHDFKDRFAKMGVDIKPGSANSDQLIGKSGKAAQAGFSMPPFHFRCRTTVDIDTVSSESYSELLPMDQLPAAPGAPAAPVPPPKLAPTAPPKPPPAPTTPKPNPVAPGAPPPSPPPPSPKPAPPKPKPKPKPTGPLQPGQFQTSEGQVLDISEDFALEARGGVGGMHSKALFTDANGETWMFKPYSHHSYGGIDQSFRAYGDKVAADVARAFGVQTAEVQVVQLPAGHPALKQMGIDSRKPVTGSIQRFARDIRGEIKSTRLDELTEQGLHQLQREHIFDFMVSNYDTHKENLLVLNDGTVFGIDKGQLFRYFGKDSLSLDFNPNANYGVKTYYNDHFRRYARGDYGRGFTLDPSNPTMMKFIKDIEDMSDEAFLKLYAPYFDAASAAGIRWNGKGKADTLNLLLERKRNLRKTVDDWYKALEKQRRAALGIVEEAAAAPPPADTFRKMDGDFVKKMRESGADGRAYYTGTNGQFRSNEILFYTAEDDGVIGEFALHKRALDKLEDLCNKQAGGQTRATSAYTSATKMAGKTEIYTTKQSAEAAFQEINDATVTLLKHINAHIVDETHHIYDGQLSGAKWEMMINTWKRVEKIADEAAPGSYEAEVAQGYINMFRKLTKSSNPNNIGLFDYSEDHVLAAVKDGAKSVGLFKPPSGSGKKITAELLAKPAPSTASRATAKASYTVKRVAGGRYNPRLEGIEPATPGGPRRVRWTDDSNGSFGGRVNIDRERAYEITFGTTKNPVRLVYFPDDTDKHSLKGRVRLFIDKDGGKVRAKDIQEAIDAMKELGLDATAATRRDMEALYILKTTDTAYPGAIKGGRNWQAGMPRLDYQEGFDTDQVIKEWGGWWKRELGVNNLKDLDGWEPTPTFTDKTGSGRPKWYRFDIADKDVIRTDLHPWMCIGQDAEELIRIATQGGKARVISNARKARTGIPMGGASPEEDTTTGGITRVFTGLFQKDPKATRAGKDGIGSITDSKYFRSERRTIRFSPRVLRDADAIQYNDDRFGRLYEFEGNHQAGNLRSMVRAAAEGNRGNEFMPRDSIDLHLLDYVPAPSEASRQRIIKLLQEGTGRSTNAVGQSWSTVVKVL
jgi:hypothetical protein